MVMSELSKKDVKPNLYSYAELRVATDDFNPSNKLGEGGFGIVYKVRIPIDFYGILFVFVHGSDSNHIQQMCFRNIASV
jgi:hypothetical protein